MLASNSVASRRARHLPRRPIGCIVFLLQAATREISLPPGVWVLTSTYNCRMGEEPQGLAIFETHWSTRVHVARRLSRYGGMVRPYKPRA